MKEIKIHRIVKKIVKSTAPSEMLHSYKHHLGRNADKDTHLQWPISELCMSMEMEDLNARGYSTKQCI